MSQNKAFLTIIEEGQLLFLILYDNLKSTVLTF